MGSRPDLPALLEALLSHPGPGDPGRRRRITQHFRLDEFDLEAGAASARFGFPDGAEYPEEWVVPRLWELCKQLEVIRAELCRLKVRDVPITVISGYRPPAYDAARRATGQHPGVAEHSEHGEGRAADVRAEGVSARELHQVILGLQQDYGVTLGGLGLYPDQPGRPGWVHVDIRPSEGRRLAQWTG